MTSDEPFFMKRLNLNIACFIFLSALSISLVGCDPIASFLGDAFRVASALQSVRNQSTNVINTNFKDEKLAYIYKNRERLHICDENSGKPDKKFAGSESKVYKIDNRRYILQYGCHSGAYFLFFEYLLYSITDYGIEIKTLPVIIMSNYEQKDVNKQPIWINRKSAQDYEKIDVNAQPLWIYQKIVQGVPHFDADNLTLKLNASHNGRGYSAEYRFEDDEFKLIKYTIHFHEYSEDKTNPRLVFGSKIVYP